MSYHVIYARTAEDAADISGDPHPELVTTSCGRLQATSDGWFLLDEAVQRLTA